MGRLPLALALALAWSSTALPAPPRQDALADRAARSGEELAREKQRTFVLVVAGLTAAVGAAGAILLLRRFRETRAEGHPRRKAESAASARAIEGPEARPKICPTCGERYESRSIRCSADGTELVLLN